MASAKVLPKKVREQLAAHERQQSKANPGDFEPMGKLYCLPRNAERFMEIKVRQSGKHIECEPIGPHFGEGCKYISMCQSLVTPDEFYCVPYDADHVLKLDLEQEKLVQVGQQICEDKVTKYGTAAASTDWQGRIYAAPFMAPRVLEIDPRLGRVRELGQKITRTEKAEWWASVASPGTMKIYALPWDARQVLQIDPMKGSSKKVGPDLGGVPGKYSCAMIAADGCIYAPPYNASKILRISEKGEISLIGPDLGNMTEAPRKYCSVCQGPNRMLYAPPLYATRVLEINPGGASRLIGPSIGNGEALYACSGNGQDGRIYCAPLQAHRVLMIDPLDHEVEEIGIDLGKEAEKYSCIAAAPVGHMMYAAPRNARFFLEVDTKRSFIRQVGKDLGAAKRKFTGILPGKPPPDLKLKRAATASPGPRRSTPGSRGNTRNARSLGRSATTTAK